VTTDRALALAVLAHLTGDYLLQSAWMAREKVKRWGPAIAHGTLYTVPFVALTRAPAALLVIAVTHTVIDRYRLARLIVIARNYLAPPSSWRPWRHFADGIDWTQYKPWAMRVIVDNTAHLTINAAALIWLG
jgi:hypothetical protein